MATTEVFAFHAFVSTDPDRRRCLATTKTPRSILLSSKFLHDETTVEKFDILLSLEARNGTYDDKWLWGLIPRSRPIARPSSHVRVQIKNPNGTVDVSAFQPSDNNYRQSFALNAARNEGIITISFVADWGWGKDGVGFSCDAIEVTSLSGPLGLFSNPSGGKYSSQLLCSDDSRDTVAVVKSKNNERLTYNKGDVLLEVTLDPL